MVAKMNHVTDRPSIALSSEEITLLKQRGLRLLKSFISFCETNNLTYYLFAGSALGAVRHKGFIPWDDDIDVCMPRSDYEKLLTFSPSCFGEKTFLQNCFSESGHILYFSKIRDLDSLFVESSSQHLNVHHGIYLDIFPMNDLPKGKIQRFFYDLHLYGMDAYINRFFSIKNNDNWFKKSIKKILTRKYRKMNVHDVVLLREKFISHHKYPKSSLFWSGLSFKVVCNKIDFQKPSKGLFEGIQVNLPTNQEHYLTGMYGDFMTLPPIEKRIPQHSIVEFKIW